MAKFVCNFISYTLGRTVDITVVIPTPTIPEAGRWARGETELSHIPEEKYPVLYLLHGTGNNHATWTGYTKAELYAEEHRIALVCMSAENQDYVDNGDGDFMTFLEEELPDFVTGIFPVSKRPEDTYIAGLSMGGFGTLVHALNYPEKYHAMGVISAGISATNMPRSLDNYDPSKYRSTRRFPRGYRPDINCWMLADKIHEEGGTFPKAYVCCGKKDGHYRANKEFAELLKQYGADVTWHEMEQYGHEWRFWDCELENILNWLPRTDVYAAKGKRKV